MAALGAEQPRLELLGPLEGTRELRLSLTVIKSLSYVVDRSSDLRLWIPLQTNQMMSNTMELQDPSAADFGQRFYRARLVPSP